MGYVIHDDVRIHWHDVCDKMARREEVNDMHTILAIPVWQGNVSTTFDFAHELLVVEADGRREISRQVVSLGEKTVARMVRVLRDLAVQVVVCGAVSRRLAEAVSRAGIRIVPHVSGEVDHVLGAYLCDHLSEPRFLQPGCCPGARRRWRHNSPQRST